MQAVASTHSPAAAASIPLCLCHARADAWDAFLCPQRVLTAEVVVHPDAEPQRVPKGTSKNTRKKGTGKSSACSVQ